MHLPRRAPGLTLIELLMFIVVVGIALAAMLRVFITATSASADPMIRRQPQGSGGWPGSADR